MNSDDLIEEIAETLWSRFDNCPGTEYEEMQDHARFAIRVCLEAAAKVCAEYSERCMTIHDDCTNRDDRDQLAERATGGDRCKAAIKALIPPARSAKT